MSLEWLAEQVATETRAAQLALERAAECDWCGESYTRRHTIQRYCGSRCQRGAADHARRERNERGDTTVEAVTDPVWAERADRLREHLPGTYRQICARAARVMGRADVMNTLAWGDGGVFRCAGGVWYVTRPNTSGRTPR